MANSTGRLSQSPTMSGSENLVRGVSGEIEGGHQLYSKDADPRYVHWDPVTVVLMLILHRNV